MSMPICRLLRGTSDGHVGAKAYQRFSIYHLAQQFQILPAGGREDGYGLRLDAKTPSLSIGYRYFVEIKC